MVMAYVEALNEPDIEFGKTLWQSLRANGTFPADGVLWLFQLQSGEWHLLIATPRVDAGGPRNAYAELAEITKRTPADSTHLSRVKLITPHHPFYHTPHPLCAQTA